MVSQVLRPTVAGVSQGGMIARRLVLAGIVGLVVMYPALVPGFQADRFTLAVIYAIVGLSVNILMGYAGQISLGHQAFVGMGAFSAAYLTTVAKVPFYLSVPMAAAIGGLSAALLGLVALRIKGLYLALITLAYGSLAERSLFSIPALTGGGAGQPAIRPGFFESDASYAYLCLAVLVFLLFVDWRMMSSKFGRALLALKSNEQVAASFGMNLTFYKIGAFVMTGVFAGLGGGLLAFREQHVVSVDFNFTLALTFVIMTVIGGLGKRFGVVIGSAFTAYLPFILNSVGDKLEAETLVVWRIAITAALLLLTVTRFPGGIAQQLEPISVWLSGRPFPRHSHGHKGKKGHKARKGKSSEPAETSKTAEVEEPVAAGAREG